MTWTPVEERALLEGVRRLGTSWAALSALPELARFSRRAIHYKWVRLTGPADTSAVVVLLPLLSLPNVYALLPEPPSSSFLGRRCARRPWQFVVRRSQPVPHTHTVSTPMALSQTTPRTGGLRPLGL